MNQIAVIVLMVGIVYGAYWRGRCVEAELWEKRVEALETRVKDAGR